MNPQIIFLLNKSLESLRNSNLESAEQYLNQAIQLDKKNYHVLRLLGIVFAQRKQYLKALEYLKKSIDIFPKNALALSNLGNVYLELKDYENALLAYDKSIKVDPTYEEAWSNKGNLLRKVKQFDEALIHYDKALVLNPGYAEAWSNKGNTLNDLKRNEEALSHYERALSLNPNYAEAWSNKGSVLHELKRYDEALSYHERALSLNPNYAEAWSNKGCILNELKYFDEALSHHEHALSLNPNYAEAWSNKGSVLNELKRYGEAIAHYDKALSLKPEIDWASGDLLHIKMKICDWSGLTESLEYISKKVVESEKAVTPFPLLALTDNALLHKKSAEIFTQSKYRSNPILGPLPGRPQSQKIRVGYFSADFRNHPVSYLTAELFELHDKNKFEIIAFSFGVDDKSPMRFRLSQAFNQFIDVSDMSDLEIAELSRNLQIDIAVDLGGLTQDSRTGIFSYRAAPIQTSYIGYLGTIDADYYDYLLADKTIIPDELQKFYSEKISYLPSYQVNDRKRAISERQFTREELGLPETGFIFCCFNNNYKILPSTFDGWMRILNAVEGSVLFLYADNEWAKANLIGEASLRGVDSTRLVFGGPIPTVEYLARYRVCDLFLDTFPYNAGTTASDALWAGLPVLTLMGQSFASRMAASLLNAIGLSELITGAQEEYEALAIGLAKNPQKLSDIKLRLANNRLTAPLFDTPLFTKNLEAAYIKMYEHCQTGLEPEHISIV
jgi:protein O-GlcNAc transferase